MVSTTKYMSVPVDEVMTILKQEAVGVSFITEDQNPPASFLHTIKSLNFEQVEINCLYVAVPQNWLQKLFKVTKFKLAQIHVKELGVKSFLDTPSTTPQKTVIRNIDKIVYRTIDSLYS